MTNRMTGINLPGASDAGWAEWGRRTVPEMVAAYRAYHQARLKASMEVLEASDGDFQITTYIGPQAHRDREILQEGRMT